MFTEFLLLLFWPFWRILPVLLFCCDSSNVSRTNITPSVLPSRLWQLIPRTFNNLTKKQWKQLCITFFGERDWRNRRQISTLRKEPLVYAAPEKSQLDNFEFAWKSFAYHYRQLQNFLAKSEPYLPVEQLWSLIFPSSIMRLEPSVLCTQTFPFPVFSAPSSGTKWDRYLCPKVKSLPW